ncbi:MAG: SEC59/DGK1/VTE5 family protein [Snowella sp.]|nr:SEC59/DGK1/VTE5 family protein [Snowella sp.]
MQYFLLNLVLETSPEIWSSVGLIALYLSLILIVAEGINRLTDTQGEITRKIVHIGSGHVVLFAWWLQIPEWIGIAAAFVAGLVALISYFLPILPSINSVGRQSLGTFFYALSIGIVISIFWPLNHPEYAAIGILVMAWGDGLAALIGQNFGNHPYQLGNIQKSWEGSLTMTVISFLVILIILGSVNGLNWQVSLTAFVVAIVATALESFSKFGVDNLTVPVGSAMLTFILHQSLL